MPNEQLATFEKCYRIDLTRKFPVAAALLWVAVSDAEQIAAWMKFPVELEARTGGAIHIDFGGRGSIDGTVCDLEAPFLFAYTWGDSFVKWSVSGDLESSELQFSHIGVKAELARGLAAAWHAFLDQLEAYLNKSAPPEGRFQQWSQEYARIEL
ncbi:MAG: SRPBCC domain-containing protein [Acidobacteriaceae bacterium]